MANYSTVDDLKADALRRAGERTDGTSAYDTTAVTYLNAVLLGLLTGGPFGPADEKGIVLPVVDWTWSRKSPPGVFNTSAYVTTGTVTATKGSTTITFSSAPAASVAGYRIRINSLSPVPRISAHTAGVATATLDAAWTEDTQTTVTYRLFKHEYALASDFLRFVRQPVIPVYPYKLSVVEEDQLEDRYPLATIEAGTPTQAALIGNSTLRLNKYTENPLRVEYNYIYVPDDLVEGDTPALPRHHRRILAVGAACLIAFDKNDDKAPPLLREMQGILRAMLQEHTHKMARGADGYGRIKARQGQMSYTDGPLRTESGLVIG